MGIRFSIKKLSLIIAAFLLSMSFVIASEEKQEEESFNASEYIMHHIQDSHEWHILEKKNGKAVTVYLPVIIYSKTSGLHIFSSKNLAHGHVYEGFTIPHEGIYSGKIIEVGEAYDIEDHTENSEEIYPAEEAAQHEEETELHALETEHEEEATVEEVETEYSTPLDLSITKNVFMMMISAIILLLIFISVGNSYKKRGIKEPNGLQGFMEPLILFVKDDIAIPNIGEHKYERYMPYLLTVFFFILLNNLMGLIPFFPFGANVTGNIAVTLVLAVITFLITQFSGNKNYWKHIFNTPGVPWWLKYPIPLMPLVEIIGIFSKPFALMIRLFANITAGHIIVLSLVSIIFVYQSVAMTSVSVVFVLFMDVLELLVAFIQAYVFTLLSALFIGMAVVEEHHE